MYSPENGWMGEEEEVWRSREVELALPGSGESLKGEEARWREEDVKDVGEKVCRGYEVVLKEEL